MSDGTLHSHDDVMRRVLRLHAGVLALVCGFIGGVGLFGMTAWLLIKGGTKVGPHLGLLGQYFYGYTVSPTGCFVGFLYGAVVGAIIGWTLGFIYNLVAGLRE